MYFPAKINGTPVVSISTFINGNNYQATEIVIEEGIERIENFCFNEFRKLKSVTLPSTINYIGKNAFRSNLAINFNVSPMTDKSIKDLLTSNYSYKNSQPNNIKRNENNKVDDIKIVDKPKPVIKPENTSVSDVDIDIPISKMKRDNTYCFIIANEEYEDLPSVEYVKNDGESLKKYCISALGIPERNVFHYQNASYTEMKKALNKMENLADATDGEAKFILYYAGHGLPSEQDASAYLIPSDGSSTDLTIGFKLSDVYRQLGRMKAASIVFLLDACFSGINRDNGGLLAARSVGRKPKNESVTGNVVVISATSDAETAMSYSAKKHGMFTYHLLCRLKESNGNTNIGDLFESIYKGVRRESILENDKNQTPSVSVSPSIKDNWKTIQF